jgi:hypothetical protein
MGENHTLIIIACNDSDELMDRIMADKAYHDECREFLNSLKTMRLEPAWFRIGLRGMPDGFIPDLQDDAGQVSVVPVEQESAKSSTVTMQSRTVN